MSQVFDCADRDQREHRHRLGGQRRQGRPAGGAAHRHRLRHRRRRLRQHRGGRAAGRQGARPGHAGTGAGRAPGTPSTAWSTRCRTAARELIRAFWPGALSLVVQQAPSLQWDLGDANGTVMLRMPLHPVAIDVLREVGPMAVSSANISGRPPAVTADDAQRSAGRAGRGVSRRRPGGPAGGVDDRRPHRARRPRSCGRARSSARADRRGARRRTGRTGR